ATEFVQVGKPWLTDKELVLFGLLGHGGDERDQVHAHATRSRLQARSWCDGVDNNPHRRASPSARAPIKADSISATIRVWNLSHVSSPAADLALRPNSANQVRSRAMRPSTS